jgi:hypothetical protein
LENLVAFRKSSSWVWFMDRGSVLHGLVGLRGVFDQRLLFSTCKFTGR